MLVRESMKDALSRHKFKILSIALTVMMAATIVTLYFATMSVVTAQLDGEKREVRTHAKTVEDLLAELNVEYKEHDYLSVPLEEQVVSGLAIEWKPAQQITLLIDGEKVGKWTTEDTVGDFLKAEKIELREEDELSGALSDKIKEGMEVAIGLAFPIEISDIDGEKEIYSTSITVEDLLAVAEIELGKLDRVTPDLTELLTASATVEIVRVEKELIEKESKVNFKKIEEKDANLLEGKTRVVTEGKAGLRIRTYEVTRENGKVISREQVKEKLARKPVDHKVAIGTKKPEPAAPAVANVLEKPPVATSGKTFTVQATAYTFNRTGPSITATGFDLRKNPGVKVIAVDPRVIPLGTKVYVEGYGHATALDTGGAVKGNIIDIFLPTHDAAIQWGRRTVKITIL